MKEIIFLSLAILLLKWRVGEVSGHGRLMDPPARNAMWRIGFPNPVNYNDNELYCGGFIVHYQKNGGKCGLCGDDYRNKVPRPHEAGGLFANGIIAQRYLMGQKISITAELTTNHKGWMEVKLCPNNDPKAIITQECLNEYPLEVVDTPYGEEHRFIIPEDSKKVANFTYSVKLPDGLTCSQCVIQWTYFAGNTWGYCTDGSEGVGCGDQETFINCADITINSQAGGGVPSKTAINPWIAYYRDPVYPKKTDSPSPLKPLIIRTQLCIPVGEYRQVPGMDDWCRKSCMKYKPYCPANACKCVHNCTAVGEFAKKPDADIFCLQNCLKYPSYCPKERCECF